MSKSKRVVKVMARIGVALLLGASAIFTLAGGWYSAPRAWHFRKVIKTADFTAVAQSAAHLIRKSGRGRGADYHGKTLTSLPKPIADLEPETVSVSEGGMLIEFARGAEGFGLKFYENDDEWIMFSYPYHPESQLILLTFRKDPKTGEPLGPPNERQSMVPESNSP
jgi:hypothetical protein